MNISISFRFVWVLYKLWTNFTTENVTYLDYVVTLGIGVAVQILSIVLGTGITFFLAFFYDLCNRSMTWFTENWLIFGLYFVPYILGNCLCQYAYFWYYKLVSIECRTVPFLFIFCNLNPFCHPFRKRKYPCRIACNCSSILSYLFSHC